MNAKTLAHDIHTRLREAVGLGVKRSHVHELIAASFGDGSRAAMLARGVMCQMTPTLANQLVLHEPAILSRALALGYPASAAGEVVRLVVSAIEERGLRVLPLDLVLRCLLDGQTELYAEDLATDVDATTDEPDLDEEAWRARHQQQAAAMLDLESENVSLSLTSAIERNDPRAHFAMTLLLEQAWDEMRFSGSNDGRYWHDREQRGDVLHGAEKEWAQGYRQRVDAAQRAEAHLEAAANLGQPDALLAVAVRDGDQRFFDLQFPQVHADPAFVARVADDVGRPECAAAWLERAAEAGDRSAMRQLVQELRSKNPLKSWTWFHLAKLHGTDLTKDDYYAIHEDGSRYDDDVGGPLFAAGQEGVELPPADEATRQLAEARAREIFSR